MTMPTKQQLADSRQPHSRTGTWQEALANKYGMAAFGFVGMVYVYNDSKALQAQQFANMRDSNIVVMQIVRDNSKMVIDNTQALTALNVAIKEGREDSRKNLTLMDKTLYDIEGSLKRIDTQTQAKSQ